MQEISTDPGSQASFNNQFRIIFVISVISFVFIFSTTTLVLISNRISVKNSNQTPVPISQIPVSQISTDLTPILSPLPFADLTIPYLRKRTYTSRLGNRQKVSDNQSYTSYLTSYDSDSLQINGLLTIPKGDRPVGGFPTIILVHGYIPPRQYQTLKNYASYVDYLARSGFVVFKIDLRGHADSEGEASGAYYSGDYIIDTLNAYAALQSTDFVSPDKIGIWGHSMAGNVVFRSFAAQPKIPAVVIWSGAVYTYSDFQEFSIEDGSYQPPPANSERARRRRELFDTHGQFNPDSPFWRQVVPTNYLSDIGGAIQINHAANDNVVSIEYSRNLMKLLDSTSIVHELHEYPSGGHNLTGNTFNQAMQKTVEFFRENLGA